MANKTVDVGQMVIFSMVVNGSYTPLCSDLFYTYDLEGFVGNVQPRSGIPITPKGHSHIGM